MLAYVFPGQGSQNKGMGGTIFDEFKEFTLQANELLGYSVKELCLEDSKSIISQTQYTQPALYVVNALSYLKRIRETGQKPDFVAGHSLGEYNALFAAGAFDFITGLKLVIKRGELMSHSTDGGMAAIVGLSEEQIRLILKNNNLHCIDIANYNSPTQIVISGLKAEIENAKSIFEENKDVKMFIPLKTSGAFHSRYMEEAKRKFEIFLEDFEFSQMSIPVISNIDARPYRQKDVKQNLIEQITHPVKWSESIRYLIGCGVTVFEEVGPGRVLLGLIQRIQREASPLVIENEEIKQITASEANFIRRENNKSHENRESIDVPKIKGEDQIGSSLQPNVSEIRHLSLGSADFKRDYGLKYAYVTGGMYHGIASTEMVAKIARNGMLGFLGTGGLKLSQIKDAIRYIQKKLNAGQIYGLNFLHNPSNQDMEEKTIDLVLECGVQVIEAAAFFYITPALVRYRAHGLKRDKHSNVIALNKIIAKVSRPEVAEAFLSPAPERVVVKLLAEGKITQGEAELLKEIPMADDICVEADSGGHTDGGVAYAMMPAMLQLRDDMMETYKYNKKVRIGAAGGIGTPEAAAAAFILGADFIMTGSINQCTVEAGTSESVKDLLQEINVQDTEYAPAGDLFELGAKVQVVKKGVFFPARANKLYDLYRQYNSLDEIDEKTKFQIQEKYFKRSFEKVYDEVKGYYVSQEIEKAERNPKHKMGLIFKWYFGYSSRLALNGDTESKVDFQVHCGPALGAFNQWVKGTDLENWRSRHVDEIGKKLMLETAELLNQRFKSIIG